MPFFVCTPALVRLLVFFVTAYAGRAIVSVLGEKFVNREFDIGESFAGISGVAVAFSFRNAVIVCRHCHLDVALHLDY